MELKALPTTFPQRTPRMFPWEEPLPGALGTLAILPPDHCHGTPSSKKEAAIFPSGMSASSDKACMVSTIKPSVPPAFPLLARAKRPANFCAHCVESCGNVTHVSSQAALVI